MIDLNALSQAVAVHTQVARILIAGHRGSTPRETGVSMLVHADGAKGTIGGGRLEYDAIASAQAMLSGGDTTRVQRQALGPALGQCCGGSVTLVTELWDAERLNTARAMAETDGVYARRVEDDAVQPAGKSRGTLHLSHGWLTEPVQITRQPVYIYGAGHVGAALANVLLPMPQFEIHVADSRVELLGRMPEGAVIHAGAPQAAVAGAGPNAVHFIMTHEHTLDFELCHHVLQRRFAYAGLIGSATKWVRFRKRLAALGHDTARIDQIECPIGDPALGKHPQQIAIGVATRLLAAKSVHAAQEDVA